MPTEIQTQNNQELIDSLRQIADYLENTPQMPKIKPYFLWQNFQPWNMLGTDEEKADQMREIALSIAKCPGTWTKEYTEDKIVISQKFGALKLDFDFARQTVCKKVKVMKEVEEWDCSPLLSLGDEDKWTHTAT